MGFDFNADEIFAIAERIEQNGERFYRRAAAKVTCEESKKLLLELAAMEEGHLKTFSVLRKKLSEADRKDTAFDPQGEAALYLQSLADSRVFSPTGDPTEAIGDDTCSDETLKEILEYSLGREKDSIIFYLGMKDMVSPGAGKSRIDDIIREEMQHIRLLSRQKITVERRMGAGS